MKRVIKNETAIDFILAIAKYIIGIMSCSIGLFSEAMLNISTLLKSITVSYIDNEKSSRWENVYNVLVGALIVIIGFCIILNIFTNPIKKVKWYMLIVSVLGILIYNIKNSLVYTINYNKNGSEIIKTSRNNMECMIVSYVVIIGYIVTLFTKYFKYLKYADAIVGFIISLYIIFIGLKYIFINFSKEEVKVEEDKIKNILNKNPFIKSINKISVLKYGASYKLIIDISLNNNSNTVKNYPQIIEACSSIFKTNRCIETISIVKREYVEKKRVVKSARNSRSRNSKKNPAKKNIKKKSRKH